jgi:hypothetical protein
MDVNGDAAAVVANGNRTVHVNRHIDPAAMSREVFVDGVVENLEHAMVKSALVGIPDIHPGAFADGLKTFEFVDLGGVVLLLGGDLGWGLLGLVGKLGHKAGRRS